MGLSHSPKIVTDGLVFAYDQANRKSYTGPTITNLTQSLSPQGLSTATGYSATSGSEYVDIPQIGNTLVNYVNIQNNYTAHTPNSGNCCPSLFGYGGYNVSASTLYTYAIVYRVESGYTNANYMYRYEYNGGTYVTEAGVHNTSNRIHLGDGWYWAWGTFTTNASTTRIGSSALFYYRYSPYPDKVSVAKIFVAAGDWTSLHPKYWPAQNTARSNTQAIVDLTGQNTVTATSPTYNSDGSFSFNGGTERLDISNTIGPIANNFSISAWVNSTDIAATQNIVSMNGPYFMRISGSKVRFNVLAGGTWLFQNGTTTLSSNTWYNFCMVYNYDSSLWIGYINGVQEFSVAKTGTVSNTSFFGYVGYTPQGGEQSNFLGQIAAVQYYNRALSAAEVQQNFNALKGRYGV